MPTIYDLKPKFQAILRPISDRLVKVGVTPNQVTFFAIFLSFINGALLFFLPQGKIGLWLLPVVLFVRMALNAIDGMMAREYEMKSALGAVLNELGDVVSDCFLYLPFALVLFGSAVWIVLAVILSVLVEFMGVVAVQIGASRRYDGPIGKSDRAFVFGAIALLLAFNVPVQIIGTPLFVLLNILILFTIFNRAKHALKEIA